MTTIDVAKFLQKMMSKVYSVLIGGRYANKNESITDNF